MSAPRKPQGWNQGWRRVTFVHAKADGATYEITAELCPGHRRDLVERVVEEEPAPMRGGRQHCTFCETRPYLGTRSVGSPWMRPERSAR